ncbi:hypothetical protein E3V55_07670 [Candidatus Marinimicrobia bacterium MT.SAG.3]|nr:hypothetical protein E3V55_07670 [Candidatus Marinimicrobia bacterium MT.SAG.3]
MLVKRWRQEYNHIRPHSSLGDRPSAPEANMTNEIGKNSTEREIYSAI